MKDELNENLRVSYPKIFGKNGYAGVGDGWYAVLNSACGAIQHHIDRRREQNVKARWFNRILARAIRTGDLSSLQKEFTYGKNTMMSDWGRNQMNDALSEKMFRSVPDKCPQVTIAQVKEKFGAMRFYYDGGDEFVSGIVDMMESVAGYSCENCGNPGKRGGSGWIKTYCDPCRSAVNKERDDEYGDDDE